MTDKDKTDGIDAAPILAQAIGMALERDTKKTLKIDVSRYQEWLDDPALSEAQKEEILGSLWSIITCFIDLGFGVSPLEEACGQLGQGLDLKGDTDSNESKPLGLKNTFNALAAE